MVVHTSKQIELIRKRLVTAQSRQKSYVDWRKRPLFFVEGEHVFLKVTPMLGVDRSLRTRKLSPHFVSPFQILEKIGSVAYKLALPPNLSQLHDVFHVSQLKKYHPNPTHILKNERIPL